MASILPLSSTQSLCPHCLRRIEARRVRIDDSVYLEKSCPEHGDLERVLLWKDYPWAYEEWNRLRLAHTVTSDSNGKGCPLDCGICSRHEQATCTAILEVSDSCNLQCPVCFAGAHPGAAGGPGLEQIEKMLHLIKETRGICPIQLSGGEPAQRDDLPEIVSLAHSIGFDHIQINTNGIRLAEDAPFSRALRDAGTTDFFLQFDGVSDEVYRKLRGAELLSIKFRALETCADLKIGVILVPTLVRNVNEDQIGNIIQFAKKWIPTVKGVHFQPMTYLGRYPESPRNEDRILIPDILLAIEEQTEGELQVEHMAPPG